uniref:uncharacterized protein n=1 Tax=Centroberyx gerrardi TaxID=166262 RepID=UPI003AAA4C33
MHHLSEKVKKHETSKMHMDSCLKLSAFGTVNIATQLDESYRIAVRRHNDEVSKNRHILARLIDCVKFCGVFELALRGKDESEGSSNPGIFHGLVNLVASLDEVFEEHLKNATVFKGTSKTTASSFDSTTVREASGFLRMLQDDDFQFFLQLFHQIMPHVDMMYQQLQKKDIDTVFIKRALQSFTSSVQAIRNQSSSQEQQQIATGTTRSRRALGENEKQRLSKEVCDTILAHAKERFSFTNHLVSATLLQGEMFEQHCHTFPVEALNTTVRAYPMLNKAKLKTELSLIYESPEFKGCCGALALYQVLQRYNLQETLSETVALLNILITTPMTTAEAERCFSTLKRIKTFLRNAMGQERLNALAMLSMERELVRNMPDFNERVIDHFAALKERRAKFQYK